MQEAGNWKPHNVKAILSNVNLVLKTRDITKLNNPSYDLIMNCDRFIAHYDLNGFQAYYEDLRELIRDLDPDYLRKDAIQDETDSDFQKWYGDAYNKSKTDIKRGLADLSENYHREIFAYFTTSERMAVVLEVNELIDKYHIKPDELEVVQQVVEKAERA